MHRNTSHFASGIQPRKGIFGGVYMYSQSHDGIVQFMGVSCFTYTVLSQGMMMNMLMVNYATLRQRFAYEKEPYHGRKEWPAPRIPLDEHDADKETNALI